MRKTIILIVFVLISNQFTQGQSTTGVADHFKNGKDLFGLKKYKLAMEEFRQVLTHSEESIYKEYASFYFAISAYYDGQISVAKSMFHQIERKYPNWNKIDEVHYWISKLNFEDYDYVQALANLRKIKSPTIAKDGVTMKKYFLDQVKDVNALNQLLSRNPYDKDIAQKLADAIIKQPIMDQDQSLLEFLILEFELDKKRYDVAGMFESVKKEEYNVAVLLPFMMDRLDGESLSFGKNLVIDLYQGIKVGVEKLKDENIKINLYAFDTKGDSITTKNLIDNGELNTMDLIIGPLMRSTSGLVSNFCYRRRINMVNPLSYTSGVMGNNPFSFLFKPSIETQAREAAEFSIKSFTNKKFSIIYGELERDSVLAYNYKDRMELDSFQVVGMHKVPAASARDMFKLITEKSALNNDEYAEEDDIGHLFLASDNERLMANTINALEARGDNLPLLGTESWLTWKMAEYEQMERLGIHFISPNYIDYTKDPVVDFRVYFHDKTSCYPSKYSANGYGLITFFGRMLNKSGIYFQKEFPKLGLVKNDIYYGIDYSLGNDNHYTPILKFVDAELKIVNAEGY